MALTEPALVLLGLLLAAWTLAAAAVILMARARLRSAAATRRKAQRLTRMLDEAPAVPLLVRSDGRIEGPQRLADWLGFEALPDFLSELCPDSGGGAGAALGSVGLSAADLAALTAAVHRTQRAAAPFRMVVTPRGGLRALALRGTLADPQVFPGGAALIWAFDANPAPASDESEGHCARDAGVTSALARLIDLAPLPMWIRAPSGELRFANAAYLDAVGDTGAEDVLRRQIELIEPVDGLTARDVGMQAMAEARPIERIISVTAKGERRAFRVTDVPMGELGSAGYAVDIEVAEEIERTFRAFREEQLEILDDVATGIARFDGQRRLNFANTPFQRIFALDPGLDAGEATFEDVLDAARDAGRLPELSNYPEWRREKLQWFLATQPHEEAWPLPSGTHLRIVGRPQPDGGLVVIAEDRTEQLRLSAVRDTMLRTRTATFDSLFESLALFAPDGRMEVWNRRFATDWGLETEFLDSHPHVSGFARKIAPRLRIPGEADAVIEAVRSATLDRRETGGRVQLADGRTLAYAGVPLPDGNGMLTVLDMTDAHKAEEALRARNAALQEADEVKARVLAQLGQEFRHPVAVIGGFAERVRDGLGGELNDVGREYIAAILTSVDQIDEQIGQLLAISRIGAGEAPIGREEIEIYALARQLVLERRGRVEQAGLGLDLRGSSASARITGDRQRLARALGTLLDSAIAATPPGGRILFEVSRPKRKGGPVRIVISGAGPGVDRLPLELDLAGPPPPGHDDQMILARDRDLPLARALIEACGGSLDYHSEPGVGSAATVELL
jgi:signal transduction histidine kinase